MVDIPRFITYQLKKRGDLFNPTPNNPEGGIIKSITAKGELLIDEGPWKLIGVPAHGPHHPDGHTVCWVCKHDEHDNVIGWSPQTWRQIPPQFLTKIQDFIMNKQQENPLLRAYFYIGFADPQTKALLTNTQTIYSRGLQTQMRMHIHLVESIPEHTPHRVLQLGCRPDEVAMETILNESAQQTIRELGMMLRGYGTQVPTEISPRNVPEMVLPRMFFGFDSFVDTFTHTLDLFEELHPSWLAYAQTFGEKRIPLPIGVLQAKQCAVPSGGILLPSPHDREVFSLTDKPVYSTPLTISGFIQTLEGAGFEHV